MLGPGSIARIGLLLGFWVFGVTSALAQAPSRGIIASTRDLSELTLEELAQIPVTSVSKKPEQFSHAAAAISVITQEDLRRSGATTIAEALRLAPGLEVARADSHSWAISSRGFNQLYANKLLVLMDGRSVYTPLFSGVYWDVQDIMLEDLERIEVIRGPGASLWGANAVNGVINITSKSAKETQGGLISGGSGTEERGFGSLRYGGQLTDRAWFRVYGKYFNRDDSALPSGDEANDSWDMVRGGFRADWEPSAQNLLTLQGDIYSGTEDQTFLHWTPTPPYTVIQQDRFRVAGGNVISRWTHSFSADTDLRIQTYYDHTRRELDFFNEDRHTADVDVQLNHPLGPRQDIIWGLGYRYSHSYNNRSNFMLSFGSSDRATHDFSAFVQDEITLVKDRMRLTLGSKFEQNDYTGWEIQPSGRLLWTPHSRHSVWASISRAVRTPSRSDVDLRLAAQVIPPGVPPGFLPAPGVVSLDGSESFKSEELLAYEMGYRVQPHDRLTLDATVFYNDYDRLTTFEPQAADVSTLPGYIRFPALFSNELEGETYGAELAANLQVTEWWRLRPSYSYLQVQLHREPGSQDSTAEGTEGDSPHHQVSLRSEMDLPWHLQFDCWGRYVDKLPSQGIPGYVSLDIRLGWRPTKHFEFSIVGQNVLDNRHAEFGPSVIRTPQAEVERGVYGKIIWRF